MPPWCPVSNFGRGGPWSRRPAQRVHAHGHCRIDRHSGPAGAGSVQRRRAHRRVDGRGHRGGDGNRRPAPGPTHRAGRPRRSLPAGNHHPHLHQRADPVGFVHWRLRHQGAAGGAVRWNPPATATWGSACSPGQQWQDFTVLVGHPEWADDPELATMGGRIAAGESIAGAIREWTSARTTEEVVREAILLRIPVAPIGNGANLPEFDQFAQRGVYGPNPGGGFIQPRVPYRNTRPSVGGLPARPPLGPAHRRGAEPVRDRPRLGASRGDGRAPTRQHRLTPCPSTGFGCWT